MKIGLALSGGGYRAAAFHIGVMARLAKDKLLEDFEAISTVSGGSIAIALVLSGNNFKWPTSKGYIKDFLPYAYRALTKSDLQKSLIRDILFWPIRLLTSRAPLVSKRLQTHMGIRIKLNQIPRSPRWVINSTCFHSQASFLRAAHEVLQTFGVEKELLRDWLHGSESYFSPEDFALEGKKDLPLFNVV